LTKNTKIVENFEKKRKSLKNLKKKTEIFENFEKKTLKSSKILKKMEIVENFEKLKAQTTTIPNFGREVGPETRRKTSSDSRRSRPSPRVFSLRPPHSQPPQLERWPMKRWVDERMRLGPKK
jgi:hypothetical protein